MKRIIHLTLRPVFGGCLLLAQIFTNRTTFFTGNFFLLTAGILLFIAGILLIINSSIHMKKVRNTGQIAVTGPFKSIRHPIYTGIYIFSTGLGLIFFSWLWFAVMIIFIPLWYIECREEEKEMLIIHGQEYSDYQNQTRMFIPLIK
jgi:protein-S-isoprenylcysteine O-methyltransferase Ste14